MEIFIATIRPYMEWKQQYKTTTQTTTPNETDSKRYYLFVFSGRVLRVFRDV